MHTPSISVVIVTYNSGKTIHRCLVSLKDLDFVSEVIVVDNNSSDNTRALVRDSSSLVPGIKLLCNDENVGFAKAQNQGARASTSSHLLILNPDTWLIKKPDTERLLLILKRKKIITGFHFLNQDGTLQYTIGRQPSLFNIITDRVPVISRFFGLKVRQGFFYHKTRPVTWVHGCGVLIQKSDFLGIGGFDEDFFMYCEDIDLCLRAHEAGFTIMYSPSITFGHLKEGMLDEKKPQKHIAIREGLLRLFTKNNQEYLISSFRKLIRYESFFTNIYLILSLKKTPEWQDAFDRVKLL